MTDVGDIIDRYRDQLPMHEHMVTMDPPAHTRERALLMRLITPKRLKDNEAFMWRLADQQLDEFVGRRAAASSSAAYAQPFAMLVVADLLGVPESEHQRFRDGFGLSGMVGEVGAGEQSDGELNALGWLDGTLHRLHRGPAARAAPGRAHRARARHLSRTAPSPTSPRWCAPRRSCSPPGQETTARLLAAALKHLAEHPELQDELREHPDLIPNFVEEALRVESPVKTDFRLARHDTRIGEVDIPAGTPVMLLNGAANRDPRRFEDPNEFRIDRPNARAHIAFGRGPHSCPGSPLARAEGHVSLAAHPRPHARHPPLRGASRPAGRASLPLRADVDPPRHDLAAPRVDAGGGGR